MIAYVFDVTLVNAIWEPAFLSGIEDQRLRNGLGHHWIQYAISPPSYWGQSEQQPLLQGGFTARGTAPPSGTSTCHISAVKPPATRGKDFASLLPKTTNITASLACMFARHVAHRTCLEYCWSATYSSATSLDALLTRIRTAWRDIPQEDIQGLFDSMPRGIETLIAANIEKFYIRWTYRW